jgi:hypothetical protein
MSAGMAFLSGVICVAILFARWEEVTGQKEAMKRFFLWMGKGFAAPAGVWVAFNSILLPFVPIFSNDILLAKNAGANLVPVISGFLLGSIGVIASYWAGFTLAGMAIHLFLMANPRREYLAAWLVYSIFLLPIAGLIILYAGWPGLGVAMTFWMAPVVRYGGQLLPAAAPRPVYSRAIARMKFGKYAAAEREVIKELEKREDDFEGWMMLAELYANHFHEMAEAAATVRELCRQENLAPFQVSLALHRLADWYLKHDDPEGARAALEFLCERLAGAHFARMAELRLRQLPSTREELYNQRQGKTVRLADPSPLPVPPSSFSEEEKEGAKHRFDACVKCLEKDPNDLGERLKCARLLACELGEPALAIEQLDLLLDLPETAPQQRAKWRLEKACWQHHLLGDEMTASRTFETVILECPQSREAFQAQQELNLIHALQRLRQNHPSPGATEEGLQTRKKVNF